MLDVVKYFHAGLCAVMIFPVCAVPWNPATWFKEPAVSPPGFFSETMQVMQVLVTHASSPLNPLEWAA